MEAGTQVAVIEDAHKSQGLEEREARKQRATQLHEQVKVALLAGRAANWAIAEALYEFDRAKAWIPLGHVSLSAWLRSPGVDMSHASYYRYVGAYEELVIRRQLSLESLLDVDITKADVVLAAIRKARVPLETAMIDARTLPKRDLRAKYQRSPVTATPSGGTEAAGDDESQPATMPDPAVGWKPLVATFAVPDPDIDDTAAVEPESVTGDVFEVGDLASAIDELRAAYESGDERPQLRRVSIAVLLSELAAA